MIPVCEPVLDGNEERYVMDCLKTNWVSSSGRYLESFEERFAGDCGGRFGIAVSSGTAALHLAMAAVGIGPGDEVVIPSFTLIVSASVVLWMGAKPVLVDVDRKTWGMDPGKIEEKLTPRTKAVMPVHMYGHPCDMDPILKLARSRGLAVIEDAAQAHGAEYQGRKVGSLGDIGCFSFYGNKTITTGEGGMLVTNDRATAMRARFLRNQAFEEPRFVHRSIGYNYRMTNIQAAIGLAQCERLEEKVARKRAIAQRYANILAQTPELILPYEASWAKNTYWMFGVVLGDDFGCTRDSAMLQLQAVGVESRPFFHPMHQQPVFVRSKDYRFPDVSGRYPVSERLGQRGLYLPSGLGLTDGQINEVCEKFLNCRSQPARKFA